MFVQTSSVRFLLDGEGVKLSVTVWFVASVYHRLDFGKVHF